MIKAGWFKAGWRIRRGVTIEMLVVVFGYYACLSSPRELVIALLAFLTCWKKRSQASGDRDVCTRNMIEWDTEEEYSWFAVQLRASKVGPGFRRMLQRQPQARAPPKRLKLVTARWSRARPGEFACESSTSFNSMDELSYTTTARDGYRQWHESIVW